MKRLIRANKTPVGAILSKVANTVNNEFKGTSLHVSRNDGGTTYSITVDNSDDLHLLDEAVDFINNKYPDLEAFTHKNRMAKYNDPNTRSGMPTKGVMRYR